MNHTEFMNWLVTYYFYYHLMFISRKELSLCNKSQFSNTYISTTKLCKPLIFQTLIVWYNRSHSLKYLRSYNIGLLRYWYLKIRVCGKDSIPFLLNWCAILFIFHYYLWWPSFVLFYPETKILCLWNKFILWVSVFFAT